jgi:23S rRNA (adenine2503-C2)-methyltransferase
MPLSEKWVITISTQYGCSMGCTFCDVPLVGKGRNISRDDLMGQFHLARSLHPEVTHTKRLNVHFARMGEPTWNNDVLRAADQMSYFENCHPVVSTMMPRHNKGLLRFLQRWMFLKNFIYDGNAGLQLSINSTNEQERMKMFRGSALALTAISEMMYKVARPIGRKITLNFAAAEYEINAEWLARLFSPAHFIVKLTPMHKTNSAISNGIKTPGDYTESYPYEHHEEALKKVGFDVLVFIASREEDLGRITCGNAILSGSLPLTTYKEQTF